MSRCKHNLIILKLNIFYEKNEYIIYFHKINWFSGEIWTWHVLKYDRDMFRVICFESGSEFSIWMVIILHIIMGVTENSMSSPLTLKKVIWLLQQKLKHVRLLQICSFKLRNERMSQDTHSWIVHSDDDRWWYWGTAVPLARAWWLALFLSGWWTPGWPWCLQGK